mgnify:CR=1 FL=1
MSPAGSCVKTLTSDDTGNVIYCLQVSAACSEFIGNTSPFAQWDPISSRVVTGTRRTALQMWDLTSGNLVQTFMGHTKVDFWA